MFPSSFQSFQSVTQPKTLLVYIETSIKTPLCQTIPRRRIKKPTNQ